MQTKDQDYIQFHQNYDQLVYIKKNETPLSPSPMVGVERMILQRRGDQVARRATSVVTYAPESSFNAHTHKYGEQYYVLEGTFSDQTGDYPTGWYVRNPVKSSHAPFSKEGTKIFVKLGQMPSNQSEYLRLNTNILDYKQLSDGIEQLILYESPYEQVFLYKLSKGRVFENKEREEVTEIFVVNGLIKVQGIQLQTQSWIRVPKNTKFDIVACENSKVYVKIGKGVVRDKQWNQISFD